jgi:hypothetical protein
MSKIIFLSALLGMALSFSFEMNRKEQYCFGIPLNVSDSLRLTYHVSGKGEKNVQYEVSLQISRVQIYDPNDSIIQSGSNERSGSSNVVGAAMG